MSRFKRLADLSPSKLRQLPKPRVKEAVKRVTGWQLQKRRQEQWLKSPCCACCGIVVAYPGGFELDHITPLSQGGGDNEANWQILCVHWDEGVKAGCHTDKTALELKP